MAVKKQKNYGFVIPIDRDINSTYFKTSKTAIEAAAEDLKMLLVTNKRERLMNPTYGIGLDSLVFEQDLKKIKTILLQRINEQITQLKHIQILQSKVLEYNDIDPIKRINIDENTLIIQIYWKLNNVDMEQQKIELEVNV